ncbi:MAG: PhoH family protein [Desulfobulbaceae bacterium]|uniref:PhoH family protein n=1 Tax=Candidatus Desulfobia pelagia TaxID=2841692 RepID=A0A8J6NA18_9BACT|nr:PhoH family protein [Candidatus Desulfobia pelagia]
MARRKKFFVLDTNVILHDSSCIYNFEEHDIVIPITVLEELDQFKKGNQSIHYHARHFSRSLDELSGDKLFNGGIQIGPEKGKIMIRLEQSMHQALQNNFTSTKPDHHILNIAYHLAKENGARKVALVTKDVNLRMKAKSVGLMAEDYTTDHVSDLGNLYSGCRLVEDVNHELLEQLHQKPFEVEVDKESFKPSLKPNEYLVLKSIQGSALATFYNASSTLKKIDNLTGYGIKPHNAEQSFALHCLLNPESSLITISGKAGTGKTLLALAAALECQKNFRQILLARPIIPLSNRDIGYLPGDIDSKLKPYMQPLFDNLGVIRNQFPVNSSRAQKINKMLEEEKLVIEPLAYIRGRSLVNMFLIVDEAQNLTPHEVKTIITRAGEGTKVIFTGDIYQIDHPYLDSQSNGLSYLIEKMQGQNLYAHVNLKKGERSELADLASNIL